MRWALLILVCAWFGLTAKADTSLVLPFGNQSATPASAQATPQPSLDWIGESLAETIRDAIEMRGGVTLPRESIDDEFRHLNLRPGSDLTEGSVLKFGQTLDVEQVVYGTFEFIPDHTFGAKPANGSVSGALKVKARIFDRRKFSQSAEYSESGNLEDLPTLEAHIAWRTLFLLSPSLAPPESEFKSLRMPVRLDAQENYIRGLLARDPDQRERFFMQSARIDPKFGHPAYQLGRICFDRKEYRQAAQWLQKVSLDDVHLHDATFLLGLALFQSGDFTGAQTAFQTLADTVPLSEVLNNLGAAQNRRRLPQAADSFEKASKGDPNDPVYYFNLGYARWKKGDYTAGADALRAALARQPDDDMATLLLGMCIKKQGPRPGDAQLEALDRLKTNFEERAYRQLKSLVEPKRR